MKRREYDVLQPGLQIDQDVATADQVQARIGRVARQVVTRKHTHLADCLADLVLLADLGEKAIQALARHVARDVDQVLALTGFGQGGLTQIGREDLQRRVARKFRHPLEQTHGDRVGLFAGCAARHPNAERRVGRAVFEQGREYLLAQDLEDLGVAEERRHRDQTVFVERGRFGGVALQIARVVDQGFDPAHRHAPSDAPAQRRLLVGAKVRTARGAQLLEHSGEPFAVFVAVFLGRGIGRLGVGWRNRPADDVRVPTQSLQLIGDAFGREHEVDPASGDGAARHAVVLRRRRLLRECDAASSLDRLQAERPIRAHAGKDHADRLPAPDVGQRLEERVDRHVRRAGRDSRDELQKAVFEDQAFGRRYDVNLIRFYSHVALHLGDLHLCDLGQ